MPSLRPLMRRVRDAFGYGDAGYSLQTGPFSTLTGMGGRADKGDNVAWKPTWIRGASIYETLYNESWAAQRFIDIPVDDMFLRGRKFEGEDNAAIDAMMEFEREFDLRDKLVGAMKSARLHGTGAIAIITKEAPLTRRMNLDRIRPGDLLALLPFDRWDLSVAEWERSPLSNDFGKPAMYKISPRLTAAFDIHASRLVRFDGVRPHTASGWRAYQQDWGVSKLIAPLVDILKDIGLAAAAAHLAQEASIPVIKTHNFKEAANASFNLPDEIPINKLAETINEKKSNYRILMMDAEDEFERVQVNFNGLPNLMNAFAERLAAAAGIPATRFLGRAPIGLNATGESDAANYAMTVGALQESMLRHPLWKIDQVASRHYGLKEPPTYGFPSLLDVSDKDLAETAKLKSETVANLARGMLIDENEAREILSNDPVIGALKQLSDSELDDLRPELPEPGATPPDA